MAQSKTPRQMAAPQVELPVTVEHTIGTVVLDGTGDDHPVVAAMRIIGTYEADHSEGGTYRFPSEDGGSMSIEVSYPDRGTADKYQELLHYLNRVDPSVYREWMEQGA